MTDIVIPDDFPPTYASPDHPDLRRLAAHGSVTLHTTRAADRAELFDRIAGVYDLMNTAMTAGLHHRWRARAAALAAIGPGSRVLDVATGTGDLAIELARRTAPGGEVVL